MKEGECRKNTFLYFVFIPGMLFLFIPGMCEGRIKENEGGDEVKYDIFYIL
jgi:hypothetical protein